MTQGLFETVLKPWWQDLPEEVRRLHSYEGTERFSGMARVDRGRSLIARLAAWVFGFPPAAEAVEVTVVKTRDGLNERWERSFDGRRFRSAFAPSDAPARYCESFGPFTFELDLPVRDGRMEIVMRRGWLLGVPLPRWALPGSETCEYAEDGKFRFDVALFAPFGGGLIVHYRGWLQPED